MAATHAIPGDEVWTETPFLIAAGEYDLLLMPNAPPSLYERRAQNAQLAERFTLDRTDARTAFVAVRRPEADWPFLIVEQAYTPHAVANDCGVVLLPETRRLFIAAGENVLAYDITHDKPRRLWKDEAEWGFWHWRVHDNVVLMAAEVGFAAWDTRANKLWSTFVEPPWSYRIEADTISLDVMGTVSRFSLRNGPPPPSLHS